MFCQISQKTTLTMQFVSLISDFNMLLFSLFNFQLQFTVQQSYKPNLCIIHIVLYIYAYTFACPVGWGCRIYLLHLCRGVRLSVLDMTLNNSDGDVPVMLQIWGMLNTPLLPSLPGPLWPGVVAPDKGSIYGLNRTKLCFLHYTDFCI